MKKSFCNSCGSEITKENFFRVHGDFDIQIQNHDFHVLIAQDKVSDDFDVCKYCVIDSINEHYDDRPKAGA